MEWTPELAVETDTKVRTELRTSRASLIRFVAENAWRLLPEGYSTAAAYVQEAAGVKRSEAYRLCNTARAAQILLARFVQRDDEPLDMKPYRWIVDDVIRSSHTGEYLCQNIVELSSDIENRLNAGETDVYQAILAGVEAASAKAEGERTEKPREPIKQSPAPERSGSTSDATGGDDAERFPPAAEIERAERIMVCPHCHTPLR